MPSTNNCTVLRYTKTTPQTFSSLDMALLRYKKTKIETSSNRFNLHSLNEVALPDDSCPINQLEVFLEATQEWKDMADAFHESALITDNHNTVFFEPRTKEDRERGYTLT